MISRKSFVTQYLHLWPFLVILIFFFPIWVNYESVVFDPPAFVEEWLKTWGTGIVLAIIVNRFVTRLNNLRDIEDMPSRIRFQKMIERHESAQNRLKKCIATSDTLLQSINHFEAILEVRIDQKINEGRVRLGSAIRAFKELFDDENRMRELSDYGVAQDINSLKAELNFDRIVNLINTLVLARKKSELSDLESEELRTQLASFISNLKNILKRIKEVHDKKEKFFKTY